MPVWEFYGLLDETVPVEESVKMARAARRNGADVRLTIDPDVHHEAWEKAYASDVGMAAGAEKERIRTIRPLSGST